ncbi:MAG: antibiotic biosynthesis monooxygenase [Gammaproteobacteria bacterium]|nr:antibiotic biosynthesis monooxygenase [Gammaproteobacteria bacterium]
MFVVTVEFLSKPEHREAFMEAMTQQAQHSLEREGSCLQFDVCRDPKNPDRVFLYEIYSDEAVFQAHLKSSHFLAFNEATTNWVAGKSVETWNRVFSG